MVPLFIYKLVVIIGNVESVHKPSQTAVGFVDNETKDLWSWVWLDRGRIFRAERAVCKKDALYAGFTRRIFSCAQVLPRIFTGQRPTGFSEVGVLSANLYI